MNSNRWGGWMVSYWVYKLFAFISSSSYKRSSTVYLFKTWKRIAAENKVLTQLIMKI